MDLKNEICWPIFKRGLSDEDSKHLKNTSDFICQHDISEARRQAWLPYPEGSTSSCILRDGPTEIKKDEGGTNLYIWPNDGTIVLEISRNASTKQEEDVRYFTPYFHERATRSPDLFELAKEDVPKIEKQYRFNLEGFSCHTKKHSYTARLLCKDNISLNGTKVDTDKTASASESMVDPESLPLPATLDDSLVLDPEALPLPVNFDDSLALLESHVASTSLLQPPTSSNSHTKD